MGDHIEGFHCSPRVSINQERESEGGREGGGRVKEGGRGEGGRGRERRKDRQG